MNLSEFKILVLPLKERLFRLAVLMLKSREDAEDALQEVFVKLWNNKAKLRQVNNLEAYAVQTTKNYCLDKLKSGKSSISLNEHDYQFEYKEATPYKKMENSDSINHMYRVFDQLPDLQKTIIYLRDVEGYSFEEIAEMTGHQINAIRVNLSRARKNARARYLKLQDYESN